MIFGKYAGRCSTIDLPAPHQFATLRLSSTNPVGGRLARAALFPNYDAIPKPGLPFAYFYLFSKGKEARQHVAVSHFYSACSIGAPFSTIKMYRESSRCIMVKTTKRSMSREIQEEHVG